MLRALPYAGASRPVALADQPVVETSLLSSAQGSALVLANYTHQNIDSLSVTIQGTPPDQAFSCTLGRKLPVIPTKGGYKLTLPLEWADIVLLLSSGSKSGKTVELQAPQQPKANGS